MRISKSAPLVLLAAAFACSCVKIDHTSVRHEEAGIPLPMFGEWQGGWTSDGTLGTGTVKLRVQTFADQALLRFEVDNPCLESASYGFTFQGRHLEISANTGMAPIQFAGDIGSDLHSLTGSYSCSADHGSWTATWVRTLAPIGDLSGTWFGSFESEEPLSAGMMTLQLEQHVDHGQLLVTGAIDCIGFPLHLAVQNGFVDWDDGHFSLILVTDPTQQPLVQLQADGDSSLTISEGDFVVALPPALPIGSGLWHAAWIGR